MVSEQIKLIKDKIDEENKHSKISADLRNEVNKLAEEFVPKIKDILGEKYSNIYYNPHMDEVGFSHQFRDRVKNSELIKIQELLTADDFIVEDRGSDITTIKLLYD